VIPYPILAPFIPKAYPNDRESANIGPAEMFLRYGPGSVYSQTDPEFNVSSASVAEVEDRLGFVVNTWLGLGYCARCLSYSSKDDVAQEDMGFFRAADALWTYSGQDVFVVDYAWAAVYLVCAAVLLLAGAASVAVESQTVAPDVLGYVSTVARNSRHLHLQKTSSAMTGPERARMLGRTEVMMQDVKPTAAVGRIALGMKHDKAEKLKPGRLYR
jgi:hypothetical protein